MLQIFGWGEDSKENEEASGRSASLSGYLWKMKREKKLVVPQWSKRWFSIEGRVLRWYQTANSESCSEEIELKNITGVSPFEAGGKGVFSFTVYYPDRNLLLRASSVSEMKMWVRAIELQADLARGGNGMWMLRKSNSVDLNKKKLKSHSLENELNRQMEELDKIQNDLDQSLGDQSSGAGVGEEGGIQAQPPVRDESPKRQQHIYAKSSPITSSSKHTSRHAKQDSKSDHRYNGENDTKNDLTENTKMSIPPRIKGSGGGPIDSITNGVGLLTNTKSNRMLMDEEDNLLNNYLKDTAIDDSLTSSTSTNDLSNRRGGGGPSGSNNPGYISSRSGSRPGSRPGSSSTRNVSYNRHGDEDSRDRAGGGGRNYDSSYHYDQRDQLSPSASTERDMSGPRMGSSPRAGGGSGRKYVCDNNDYDERYGGGGGGGGYRGGERGGERELFNNSRSMNGGGGGGIERPSSYQKVGPDEEVAYDDDDLDYKTDVRIRRAGGSGSGMNSRPGSGASNRSSRDSSVAGGSNNNSRRIITSSNEQEETTTSYSHSKRFEPRTMSAWT